MFSTLIAPMGRIILSYVFFLISTCVTPCVSGGVVISEFLADNANGIKDENDTRQDWIELYNDGAETVSLNGWWLTDSSSNLAKWEFPNVSIAANSTLLVWASGKNRRVAGQPLHTNFSLAKSGEYLGLFKPNALTGQPEMVNDYAPLYPAQATDVSYGRSFGSSQTVLLSSGASGKYKFPTSATVYSGTNFSAGEMGHGNVNGWNRSTAFNDSGWINFTSGLGYDANGNLSSLVGTNIQTSMRNIYTSVCTRMKFSVADPSRFDSIKIRVKYEDGCGIFLNGSATPVAQYGPPTSYSFNATAPNAAASTWQQWWETTLPASSIVPGDNLLAIQGFNTSLSSSDFLILPEVIGVSNLSVGAVGYFSTPSPNATNGTSATGPIFYDALPADPGIPRPLGTAASPPLTVSVRVISTASALSVVRVIPRLMYDAELTAIPMKDDGIAPDLMANDGLFTANIPTSNVGYGQMLRWRFEAVDASSNLTKLPAYLSTTDSPQYFGTVALRNDLANTQLPILDWFVQGAPANGPTTEPFRGSMYYLGYFYDNIGHKIHGQSTAGFAKKSYDFDSNSGYRFLWKIGEERVKDINLLSNYADKTKTRNTLSHEIGKMMGAPYHYAFPVRVHLNAQFHGILDFLEDGDDRMLERNGLDPEGAFYKIYNETMSTSAEKKTRLTEPNTDLNTFTTSLDATLPMATRRTYAYDNVNIPATINYLVLRQFNSDGDHGHKNYYLYRDTNKTGEWMPIVWDVDLSHGHQWNGNNGTGGYFNDTLVTNNPLNRHSANNRLYNLLLESPEFQQMFARRMRTVMDTILQAPGTTNGVLETRMREIAASVDPNPANPSPETDGDLDRAKWGVHVNFIDNRPREEVERVITGYFGPRRTFLFDQTATRPLVQRPGLTGGTALPNFAQSVGANSVTIDSIDYYPSSESQNGEYIILRNNTSQAIDLTGWKISGAIDHTFTAGTVIPAGNGSAAQEYLGLLHVVKNTAAFRSRTAGPKGGEKRFIQGNYVGQLSSRGETITLTDPANQVIASMTYAGAPTIAQQSIRITEIQYNPAAPTAAELTALPGVNNDDFEFIEITNSGTSAVDLSSYIISGGINFTIPASTVLQAGARLIVAKRPAAFLLRHPQITSVIGGFDDNLSNGGERIELTESSGEVVVDFSYSDLWYPVTDGQGYSLVLRNAETAHNFMGNVSAWVMSPTLHGSPGTGDNFPTIEIQPSQHTFNNTPRSAIVTTKPAGISHTITYNGQSTPPTDAGTYTVVATLNAPNYEALAASSTLVIEKSPQQITFNPVSSIPLDGGFITCDALASSSLPVLFELTSGPATLDDTKLTPTASGIIQIKASQMGNQNYHATEITRSILCTSDYQSSAWRLQHFNLAERSNNAISGFDADPDHDGWNNLIEYACLTNPKSSDESSPPVEASRLSLAGKTYQLFRFRKRAKDIELSMTPEMSGDLQQWNHGSNHFVPHGSPVTHSDGSETVSYRSVTPIGERPQEFLRLRVSKNP